MTPIFLWQSCTADMRYSKAQLTENGTAHLQQSCISAKKSGESSGVIRVIDIMINDLDKVAQLARFNLYGEAL